MTRALGLIMVLWYVSHLFSQTFESADSAFSSTFKALEANVKNGFELQIPRGEVGL